MLAAFLLLFGAVLWLTHQISVQSQRKELVSGGESLGETVRLRLKGNADYLLLLAQQRGDGTLDARSFQERASQYVRFHPEMINITWVDADFVIRGVAPLAENRQIMGLKLTLPEPKRVSDLAMRTRQPVYTRPFEAIQGKPSFEVWVPVYRGDTFLGLFGGVYSCERILKELVSQEQGRQYQISLIGAGALLAELSSRGEADEGLVHRVEVTPGDSGVTLRLKKYRQGGQDWRLLVLELSCLALVLAMSLAMWNLKREVAARKRTEDALRASQAGLVRQKMLLDNIIEGTTDAVFAKDTAGRYLIVNHEVARMYNRPAEEIIGRDDTHFLPADEVQLQMEADRDLIAQPGTRTREESLTTIDGRRIFLATKGPINDEQGTVIGLFGISRDITEQRRLEEQLRQSLKMESIGRLAGGVAHDFNNKLTIILGYAELSRLAAPEGSKLWHNLNGIITAAGHSREITAQLLAFSRQQAISPRPLNLNHALADTRRMLPRLIGEDIVLTFDLADDLWQVTLDSTQLDQIVMNLAVNARDAMPAGGRLTISTANTAVDRIYCNNHLDAKPGDYVRLTFSDTGHGIEREQLKHIFEPFYTTKEIGKGTGLGLATIYGIVTQNNGFINVYSEPDYGSVFSIFLPRLEILPDPEVREHPASLSGSGTVLLVEDDETVRGMTVMMLEELGYAVRVASNPDEAIRICGDQAVPVDIVLSDVIMPEMNGKDMIDRIKIFRPGIKVLYMSGYSFEVFSNKGVMGADMSFIQKPFDMAMLHRMISETIDT
ncbi:hypothetical protein GSbR_17340 [Geobacter sp. SVR]|nr:hypothetical protein GSVR_05120 [Geobacter sp. SVR]GCF85134.1 hypothetical protein GSbR_17340 [Geobacter sp. SVR]